MDTESENTKIWYEAQEVVPQRGYLGMLVTHTMGGVSQFLWVENRERFIELVCSMPYVISIPEEPDQEVIDLVDRITRLLLSSTRLIKLFIKELEELNESFFPWEILWWGDFDNLLNSRQEHIAEIREEFWTAWAEENELDVDKYEGKRTSIPDDRVDEFAQWVRSYGY